MPATALGSLIHAGLDEKRWTLADLARATGLAYNSLRSWLVPGGSRSSVRPENVKKVSDALGVPAVRMYRAAARAAGYDIGDENAELVPVETSAVVRTLTLRVRQLEQGVTDLIFEPTSAQAEIALLRSAIDRLSLDADRA